MSNTVQKRETGNDIPKWIYVAIIVVALGFGTYGYFKVKKWVRYAAIEKYEKPITDFTITKVYYEKEKFKTRRRGSDDDVEEKKPDYFMEVSYKGKDYKLEIEEYTYSKYNNNPEDVTLFYDNKSDEIFVAGIGGANLLVTALAAIVLVIIILFLLVRLLIKSLKKKRLKRG